MTLEELEEVLAEFKEGLAKDSRRHYGNPDCPQAWRFVDARKHQWTQRELDHFAIGCPYCAKSREIVREIGPFGWLFRGMRRSLEFLKASPAPARPRWQAIAAAGVVAFACILLVDAIAIFHKPVGETIAGLFKGKAEVTPAVTPILKDNVLAAGRSPSGGIVFTGRDVPSEWGDTVREMIRSGTPELSPIVAPALAATEVVRQQAGSTSEPGAAARPMLLSPVGTVVESDRPTFSWDGTDGLTNCEIAVSDETSKAVFNLPINKGQLAEKTLAIPPGAPALRPGQTYSWQIDCHLHGMEKISDSGKFVLPDAQTLATIGQLQSQFKGSAMLIAAVDEKYGLYDDAEARLKELQKLNPGFELPQKLLKDLAARRQKK